MTRGCRRRAAGGLLVVLMLAGAGCTRLPTDTPVAAPGPPPRGTVTPPWTPFAPTPPPPLIGTMLPAPLPTAAPTP